MCYNTLCLARVGRKSVRGYKARRSSLLRQGCQRAGNRTGVERRKADMGRRGEQKFCMYCGVELPQGAVFCPSCGGNLKPAESDDSLDEEDAEQEYEESEENGIDESVDEDESEEQLDEEEYDDEEEPEEQQNEEECEEEEESEEQLDNEESFNKQEEGDEEGFLKSFGKRFLNLKSLNRLLNRRSIKYLLVFAIVYVVGVIVYGSWKTNTNPFKFFIINPPVEVSVRGGYLSESVVQVRNDSDKPIEVQVCLYRQSSLGLGLIGARSSMTRINPYETKDFGVLELEGKWDPGSGDKGFVFVNGYLHTLRFELSNSRCSSEFGFCSPADSPFEVKRNGIFKKE